MKQNKIIRGMIIALCVFAFTGCNTANTNDSSITNATHPEQTNDSPEKSNEGDDDANSLIESANLQGNVVDFTENGSTISPVVIEHDGLTAADAAPGADNSDNNINVKYNDDCIFEIATINTTTEKATLTSCSISDIKKETNLVVYGTYQEDKTLNATKVIIMRYEEDAE